MQLEKHQMQSKTQLKTKKKTTNSLKGKIDKSSTRLDRPSTVTDARQERDALLNEEMNTDKKRKIRRETV